MLVAIDVVACGRDIDDMELVINYDVPHQPEDYVHRIGRTARAGAKGEAMTLVTPQDRYRFDKIERFIERAVPRHISLELTHAQGHILFDSPQGHHSTLSILYNHQER